MIVRKPHMMGRRRAAEMRARSLQGSKLSLTVATVTAPVVKDVSELITTPKKKAKR
jgi:hypothetical protein